MADNAIITILDKVDEIATAIQEVKAQGDERPPIVLDTNKLGAELAMIITKKMDEHGRSGEAVAERIETAAAKIPEKLGYVYSIDVDTRWMFMTMTIMLLVGLAAGYMISPKYDQKQLDYRSGQVVERDKAIEEKDAELDYFRSRNPRDAAKYDKMMGR